jgi:hypothetical protein
MAGQMYKKWKITLSPTQQDSLLWACAYECELKRKDEVLSHRDTPAGQWDTRHYAEAAALQHAKAWIDLQMNPAK